MHEDFKDQVKLFGEFLLLFSPESFVFSFTIDR